VDDRTRAFRRIADAARRMLAGELSYLEGSRVILASRRAAGIPERDPDMTALGVVESETAHLPVGAERDQWAHEALTRMEPAIRQAEEWARHTAEEETRRLLQRFACNVDASATPASSPARLAKLSALINDEWVPNVHERVWWQEETTGPSRIVAAVSKDQIGLVLRLAACASEPFLLLWVLHTPRAGTPRGRYQSPPLVFPDAEHLLLKYRALFEQDGRSDIWIHARPPELTVVLDQHDLIYAYGPIEALVARLEGVPHARTAIPSPHAHHYHAEFDDLERMLASELEWTVTELEPDDDP
jgi:hypothetical protein